MWEISNNSQIFNFILSLCFGFVFCFVYDLFRAFRICFKFKDLTIAFQDIFYFLVTSITTFCLLLVTVNGQIRGYILFGILIGFLIFKIIFSKPITVVFVYIIKLIKKIYLKINAFLMRIFGIIGGILVKIFKIIRKIAKKVKNTCKILLQKLKCLLYNKANNNCGNGVCENEAQK